MSNAQGTFGKDEISREHQIRSRKERRNHDTESDGYAVTPPPDTTGDTTAYEYLGRGRTRVYIARVAYNDECVY